MWCLWDALCRSFYAPPSASTTTAHPASAIAHETLTRSRSRSAYNIATDYENGNSISVDGHEGSSPAAQATAQDSIQSSITSPFPAQPPDPNSNSNPNPNSDPNPNPDHETSLTVSQPSRSPSSEHKRMLDRLDDLLLFHGRLLAVIAIRFRLWAEELLTTTSLAPGGQWDAIATPTLDVRITLVIVCVWRILFYAFDN